MKLIAAMGENRVIGRGNGMPWDVPEEYQHYLDTVRGATVLMGRRSYEIFGRDTTATHIVVLSRNPRPVSRGAVCTNLAQALSTAAAYGKPIFSCGGASVYDQTIPFANELHLSTIKGSFSGETYFPEFETNEWKIAEERDEDRYVFRRWIRKIIQDRPFSSE